MTYTRFTCQRARLIKAAELGNSCGQGQTRGRELGPRCQPQHSACGKPGVLWLLFSSEPILSQVTCSCVWNKLLSWLWEGLLPPAAVALI